MRWTRTPRRPRRLGCRPGIDRLEARCLLANAPSALGAYEALIGAEATRAAYHVDGSGLSAAVIDTGINYRHDDLGDGYGPGHKVLDGYDFGDNDADPDATSWQHGTAVAGVLAANGPGDVGVAPGAGLVALRVFGNNNQGGYDKIAEALQWVLDHHDRAGISVVNLSVSDGNNYTSDGFPFDGGMAARLKGLIAQLKALNIPVVTAAGNSYAGQQGMGYTAIMRDTISVTATDQSDQVLSNAQRLGKDLGGPRATDLAAPGKGLRAPSEGESYSSVEGTSFAAPVVSGAILLLQSIYRQRFGALPTVDQLVDWLQRGADTIRDEATGITLPRLNIARSASLIPPAPAPPPGKTPAPPQETPPTDPAPSPGPGSGLSDAPSVALYRNGEYVGEVASDSAANPLKDAFAAFGLAGTFTRIDSWSAAQTPAKTGRVEPSGTAVRMRTRADGPIGEPAAALAAFHNRAALFRAARPGLARLRQARLARRASER
jgi:type VI secretion system secreted protein VgrG